VKFVGGVLSLSKGAFFMNSGIKNFVKTCRQVQDNLNFNKFLPRPQDVTFSIPVSSWTLDNSATDEFIYFADINIVGVTANDTAEINFDNQNIVDFANISDSGESFSGKLRIFAENIPTDTITGTASITKGVSSS